MDTGSGHIYPMNEIKLEDIKGNLVQWNVGEEVEVKGCKFKVAEIEAFPFDKIVLRGIPNLDTIPVIEEE